MDAVPPAPSLGGFVVLVLARPLLGVSGSALVAELTQGERVRRLACSKHPPRSLARSAHFSVAGRWKWPAMARYARSCDCRRADGGCAQAAQPGTAWGGRLIGAPNIRRLWDLFYALEISVRCRQLNRCA